MPCHVCVSLTFLRSPTQAWRRECHPLQDLYGRTVEAVLQSRWRGLGDRPVFDQCFSPSLRYVGTSPHRDRPMLRAAELRGRLFTSQRGMHAIAFQTCVHRPSHPFGRTAARLSSCQLGRGLDPNNTYQTLYSSSFHFGSERTFFLAAQGRL